MNSHACGRFTLARLLAALILIGGAATHISICPPPDKTQDIYYSWLEGRRICLDINPYARVLEGDMRHNDKYATYFPGFYLLSALSQKLGLREYGPWLRFWRAIFLLCFLAIGVTLFIKLEASGAPALGLAALAIWLFNRWSLYVWQVGHLDFLALLLVVWALLAWRRSIFVAAALFSCSLAFKQIAIFLVPLFLIWVWRQSQERPCRRTLVVGAIIATVPLLTSAPFLVWNAEGFIKSVLFSATRVEIGHFPGAATIDAVRKWDGAISRFPLIVVLLGVYFAAFQERPPRCAAAFLVMAAFILFNRTIFHQYLIWPIALGLLALNDTVTGRSRNGEDSQRRADSTSSSVP